MVYRIIYLMSETKKIKKEIKKIQLETMEEIFPYLSEEDVQDLKRQAEIMGIPYPPDNSQE